jgi:beta-glucanase (GH16 family)
MAPRKSLLGRTGGVLVATVVLTALVAPAGASGAARHHHEHTKRFRAHVTITAHESVKISAVASATASAGNPAVTARATAHGTARASARATRSASVTVQRSAATSKRARARARAAARSAARRLAASRAHAVARSRALAAARAKAHRRAVAAAEAAAAARANAAANPACADLPKSDGGTWTCTFDEEFNGTSLDKSRWLPITTAANGRADGPACWVDSPNNISVSGGTLNLTVRKEAQPFTCKSPKGDFTAQYTTGQVATYSKFAQTYGRFAVRASFPASTIAGLQSSLWLWPQNNIASGLTGEIDIAEEYSIGADRAVPYLHYAYDPTTVNAATGTNVVTNNYCMVKDVHAFHEYVLEWTPTTMKILFDNKTCMVDHFQTLGASPFNQPFFVTLTQALGVGANSYVPGSTPLPATTRVDWVRAWK